MQRNVMQRTEQRRLLGRNTEGKGGTQTRLLEGRKGVDGSPETRHSQQHAESGAKHDTAAILIIDKRELVILQ